MPFPFFLKEASACFGRKKRPFRWRLRIDKSKKQT